MSSGDAELVLRVRQGELEAFEALYQRYKGPIYRTALAITHDHGVAEEVLQDCFLRAYAHLDRVDGSSPLGPWLQRIAVNLARNRLQRKQFLFSPIDDVVEHLLDHERSPEEVAEGNEVRSAVQASLRALGFNHRAVAVLYYLHGYTHSEIAYVLDCPLGTVKSRLHYATQQLRRYLAGEIAPQRRLLAPAPSPRPQTSQFALADRGVGD